MIALAQFLLGDIDGFFKTLNGRPFMSRIGFFKAQSPICRPSWITRITADVSLAADLSRAQREVRHDPATRLPNA